LIGAFHQPRLVLIDINTLATLDDREYRSGLAEVIKYGIIYEESFFNYLEENAHKIMDRNPECLSTIIYHSCRIKSEIVAKDEREEGLRAILNLGHTFGHAIEKLTGYNVYRHGEAVAMGTIAAVYLAQDEGLLQESEVSRITQLYRQMGIPTAFPALKAEEIYTAMLNDKKIIEGRLRIVLPRGIGDFTIVDNCSQEKVIKAISRAST
jgi:3-dehydroquinate synthase